MQDIKAQLKDLLKPSEVLVKDIASLNGDILILGVGGKIGPSLALLCRQAIEASGVARKVIGVARFSESGLKEQLEKEGIETHVADLMNETSLASLPYAENVLYLAGTKFGTKGNEPLTWAMNTYLPGLIAEKYKNSKIVVYSTGNVYPFSPVIGGGPDEATRPAPVGEYGQSCLGRERIFQYFSQKYHTPLLIYRLNYANDLRYGVLLEIARSVKEQRTINLDMGHVNVIWQGDANEMAIRSLLHCSVPGKLLNVTGPETTSVRWLAEQFGTIYNKTPVFAGEEQSSALLSNAAESFRIFGYPKVSLKQMVELTAHWLLQDGETLQKPTKFQERQGQF